MIVIVMGVVGAGKTTVGKLLAQKLGWKFADADDFFRRSLDSDPHGICGLFEIVQLARQNLLVSEVALPGVEPLRDQGGRSLQVHKVDIRSGMKCLAVAALQS